MTKDKIEVLIIGLDDIKLTGISRHGCAVTNIDGNERVLISRTTFTRLLNQPGYTIKCVIVPDAEPFKGYIWKRLHTLGFK